MAASVNHAGRMVAKFHCQKGRSPWTWARRPYRGGGDLICVRFWLRVRTAAHPLQDLQRMKAAIYSVNGDPGVITFAAVPDPVPANNEVLVRNAAISIEGGDLLSRKRLPPSHTPYIVGYAAAGEVVAVGADVNSLRVG